MPITKSAKKALRVSVRRHTENLRTKESLRTAMRKTTKSTLPRAFGLIDKAVKKHIIHPNKAARLKAQLVGRFSRPQQEKKPTKKR